MKRFLRHSPKQSVSGGTSALPVGRTMIFFMIKNAALY